MKHVFRAVLVSAPKLQRHLNSSMLTKKRSGTWKFSLAKSPFDAPSDFFEKNFDAEKWGDIKVPGMWQLQGYGKGPQ